MKLTHLFISPRENRLRAGWRLLVQAILLLLMSIVLAVVVGLLVRASRLTGITQALLGTALVSLPAITVSVYLARRYIDRRTFVSLGLRWDRRAGRDLAFGIAVTGAVMGLIFLAELALGWTRFVGFGPAAGRGESYGLVLLWLVIFVMVGWYEELLNRGYQLRNLAEGLNLPLAALISAVFFSLDHSANPNTSWASYLGLFIAGLWFAFAAIRSGRLWLPIGAHIGWNIFEGIVFGFPVSGLDTPVLIHQAITGPTLWTGGAFGPEAGLIVWPALALSALAIWAYTRGRKAAPVDGEAESGKE